MWAQKACFRGWLHTTPRSALSCRISMMLGGFLRVGHLGKVRGVAHYKTGQCFRECSGMEKRRRGRVWKMRTKSARVLITATAESKPSRWTLNFGVRLSLGIWETLRLRGRTEDKDRRMLSFQRELAAKPGTAAPGLLLWGESPLFPRGSLWGWRNLTRKEPFLSVVLLIKCPLPGWHMVGRQHTEGNFHPAVYKDYFLMDTFSGKRRAPCWLQVTLQGAGNAVEAGSGVHCHCPIS